MAAKKMFPPGGVGNTPGKAYDEVKLRIDLRMEGRQIVMQFSDQVEWIRMSSGGARKLATLLIEKANEQDRLGTDRKTS
jgi:hypothetical protein